jgi:hypothetical protein
MPSSPLFAPNGPEDGPSRPQLLSWPTGLQTLANSLVGFGTSAALAKGMGEFAAPSVPAGDSILALLLGSTISVWTILLLKRTLTRNEQWLRAAGWMSAISAAFAAGLYLLHAALAEDGRLDQVAGWVFLVGLCAYFASAFVSRTCRTDVSARQDQQVGWVESGYALGCALGLVTWQSSKLFGMQEALLLNVLLMLAAALLDRLTPIPPDPAEKSNDGGKKLNQRLVAASILFLVAMTVLVQISTQRLAKVSNNLLLLVAFDIGTLVGSLGAAGLGLTLTLWAGKRQSLLASYIHPSCRATAWMKLPFFAVALIAGGGMLLSVWGLKNDALPTTAVLPTLVVVAIVYEGSAIAMADWLGKGTRPGVVSLAYGLMASFGTAVYATLLYADTGHDGCFVCVVSFMAAVLLALLIACPAAGPNASIESSHG